MIPSIHHIVMQCSRIAYNLRVISSMLTSSYRQRFRASTRRAYSTFCNNLCAEAIPDFKCELNSAHAKSAYQGSLDILKQKIHERRYSAGTSTP